MRADGSSINVILLHFKLAGNGGKHLSPSKRLPTPSKSLAGSSRAYDLHQKKAAYRRNGVHEHLVWITGENRLVWWELRDEAYHEIAPKGGGLLQSVLFPGLWFDTQSLLCGDMKAVLTALRRA